MDIIIKRGLSKKCS